LGPKDLIKELVSLKASKAISPPEAVTNYPVWGTVKDLGDKTLALSKVTFIAVPGDSFKIEAFADLEDEARALTFLDELEGFRAIKAIQSMDEPWLADLITSISLSREGKRVTLRADIDTANARRLLKKGGI